MGHKPKEQQPLRVAVVNMDNDPQVVVPEQDPVVPQDNWEPPGGDVNFDDIFGGAGDGSTDLSQKTAQQPGAAEPVKTPEPPAEPQAPAAKTPFQLRTNTGSTYNSLEDTIKGIEEKDRNLAILRNMVEAATGADPLKKGASAPSTVRYTNDSRRYAEDLTKAADVGQKTGNWDSYRDVQAKFQLELLEQTVGPYLSTVQKVGRQEALDSVSKTIPGFKDFYNSDDYHKALEARPKLKETIDAWERQPGPQAQETLSELYGLAYDTSQARKLPELLRTSPQQPSTSTTPRMPLSSTQLTPQQPNNSQNKPSMDNSAGRKVLIQQLENKGVKDFRF